MSTIKEHEYIISGVFFLRKTVRNDRKENTRKNTRGTCAPAEREEKIREDTSEKIREEYELGRALVGLLVVLASVFVVVLAIVVFRQTATQNSTGHTTEWSQLDNIKETLEQYKAKLNAVEGDLKTAREQNNELSMINSKIADEKNELSRNLTVLEGDIKSLNDSLEAAKLLEKMLQDENKALSDKKNQLFKDLDDTKYKLGSCKNKNMDHEVRSMELLEEIEGLKKELKACK